MKKVNEKDFDLVSGGRIPDAAGGGGGWGPAISGGIIGAGSDTLNKELKGEKQTLAGAAGAFAGGAVSGINNLGNTGSAIAGAIAGASAEKIVEKAERDNSSRVICTHFYQKGMLSRELWRADMEYTLQYLPQSMVNGYHLWAIPYVRLMRKSPLAEKLMYPIAYHRAREIAYQMGYLEKGSIRGKIFRAILEPVCAFLGMFTTERKYQELWRNA